MLNPDSKDMLSCLKDERVDFLVVGAYALHTFASSLVNPENLVIL
jgi:hypothetical protein